MLSHRLNIFWNIAAYPGNWIPSKINSSTIRQIHTYIIHTTQPSTVRQIHTFIIHTTQPPTVRQSHTYIIHTTQPPTVRQIHTDIIHTTQPSTRGPQMQLASGAQILQTQARLSQRGNFPSCVDVYQVRTLCASYLDICLWIPQTQSLFRLVVVGFLCTLKRKWTFSFFFFVAALCTFKLGPLVYVAHSGYSPKQHKKTKKVKGR